MSPDTILPRETVLMTKNSLKGIYVTITMVAIPQYAQAKEKKNAEEKNPTPHTLILIKR